MPGIHGFFSYSRELDVGAQSALFSLHADLVREVAAHGGHDLVLHREPIHALWAPAWEDRLVDSLREATFFVPVLTPEFFEDPVCRREALAFLRWARALPKHVHVRSLYVLPDARFDDPARRVRDPIMAELYQHPSRDLRAYWTQGWRVKGARDAVDEIAEWLAARTIDVRHDPSSIEERELRLAAAIAQPPLPFEDPGPLPRDPRDITVPEPAMSPGEGAWDLEDEPEAPLPTKTPKKPRRAPGRGVTVKSIPPPKPAPQLMVQDDEMVSVAAAAPLDEFDLLGNTQTGPRPSEEGSLSAPTYGTLDVPPRARRPMLLLGAAAATLLVAVVAAAAALGPQAPVGGAALPAAQQIGVLAAPPAVAPVAAAPVAAECGDGEPDPGEECDFGSAYNGPAPGGCTAECRLPWREIPAGTYRLGSSPTKEPDRRADEPWARDVASAAFRVLATEVTDAQRARFGTPRDGDRPAAHVSWHQASAFCESVGGRLPTEAEWEVAARGASHSTWSCGDDPACLKDAAWFASNARGQAHPVAGRAPNALGLYDMAGNLAEWTADCYDPAAYRVAGVLDAQIAVRGACVTRVVRGGSFVSPAETVRAAFRGRRKPEATLESVGFRCVQGPATRG